MNMYEDFPFWNTLLVECGFKVQLSDPSSPELFRKGVGTVMSDTICFPAKLAHGHIQNLIEKKVDRIFYPMVFSEHQEFDKALNSYNCPVVTGYPDVIRSAIDPWGSAGIPLDMPSVTFHDEKLLRQTCERYLRGLGVGRRSFQRAFAQALEAQREYKAAVRAAGARLLEQAREEGRPVILLMGRPYHLDPLINHGVPRILVDFGVDVITEDAVPLDGQPTLDHRHVPTHWASVNRFYHAARWAGQQDDVEVVQLNSFACGPDAYSLDEVKSILNSLGKSHTTIRIDEIESTGSTRLRLRSLIETLKSKQRPRLAAVPRSAKQAVRGRRPPADHPDPSFLAFLRADHRRSALADGLQDRDPAARRSRLCGDRPPVHAKRNLLSGHRHHRRPDQGAAVRQVRPGDRGSRLLADRRTMPRRPVSSP